MLQKKSRKRSLKNEIKINVIPPAGHFIYLLRFSVFILSELLCVSPAFRNQMCTCKKTYEIYGRNLLHK